MKEMLIDYAGFLLETVTVLVAFIIAVIFVAAKSVSSVGSHADSESDGDGDKSSRVVIRNESAKYQEEVDRLRLDLLDDDSRKCVDEFMKKKEKSSGSKKSDEAKKLDEALKALAGDDEKDGKAGKKEKAGKSEKSEKSEKKEKSEKADRMVSAESAADAADADRPQPEAGAKSTEAAQKDDAGKSGKGDSEWDGSTEGIKDILDSAAKKPRLFIIDFNGDVMASDVRDLRRLVSSVLAVGRKGDEVVLRLESPGGSVPHYGLAASELMRIRRSGMRLTVCVDRVAASGGYMMACTSDHIVAAPFAIVGSIGVVAEFPNFHRLLQKLCVDYEQETAGEYKRTLTQFGDNSDPEARKKFEEQLADVHRYFKKFVKENRPAIDIDKVATGEFWFGEEALQRHLIDEIMTSDDYVISRIRPHSVWRIFVRRKKKLGGILDSLPFGRSARLLRGALRHLPFSRLRA